MRAAVNHVLAWSTLALLRAIANSAAAEELVAPSGAGQWVPSLAVITGVTFEDQNGFQASYLLDGESANPNAPQELRPARSRGDRMVVPYVGGSIELMTPSLHMASFPRFFVSGEVMPTFGSERTLALDSQPSRIRGPELNAVLAVQEDDKHFQSSGTGATRPREQAFGESDANGQGMKLIAQTDELSFGAKMGAAFAFELRGRQLRIKPSVGWLRYKVGVKGALVDPSCKPSTTCTNVYEPDGTGGFVLKTAGFLRESIITAHDSGTFDGFGPGIELEMDTARMGPIGAALFLGIHAYYIVGDRDIAFGGARSFNDQLGNDTDLAFWRMRVAPWTYRGGIGLRFLWLGSGG